MLVLLFPSGNLADTLQSSILRWNRKEKTFSPDQKSFNVIAYKTWLRHESWKQEPLQQDRFANANPDYAGQQLGLTGFLRTSGKFS
jgi:hypothetical protein